MRLLAAAGAWSLVMMYLGAIAVLDWPQRLTGWGRAGAAVGMVLLACGAFVFAAAAGRVFPRASPRVTVVFEVMPWILLILWVLGTMLE